MEINFELALQDFYDSIRAHRTRSAFSKWSYRLLLFILCFGPGICLINLVFNPLSRFLEDGLPLLLLGAFWLLVLWILPKWNVRRQFIKQPSAHGPKKLSLDAAGLHWKWSGGSTDLEWQHFTRVLESKKQFLFYSSPVVFNVLPKRVLTVDQMADIRKLLATYLPQEKLKLGSGSNPSAASGSA
jgi:hypothetical protein